MEKIKIGIGKSSFFTFIAMIYLIFLVPTFAFSKFMTLPFNDPNVKLQQGWLYDLQGTLCGKDNPDYPYCHYGFDYIKGEINKSSTWTSFEVRAVADGTAKYFPNGSATWGNYVVTKHTVNEKDYYTVNTHLEFSKSIASDKWVDIKRGDLIGIAGKSGSANDLIHLHFEVYNGSYTDKSKRVDPYDIYKNKSSYPPHGNCGPNYLWTECPPVSFDQSLPTRFMDFEDGVVANLSAAKFRGWNLQQRKAMTGFTAIGEPVIMVHIQMDHILVTEIFLLG